MGGGGVVGVRKGYFACCGRHLPPCTFIFLFLFFCLLISNEAKLADEMTLSPVCVCGVCVCYNGAICYMCACVIML